MIFKILMKSIILNNANYTICKEFHTNKCLKERYYLKNSFPRNESTFTGKSLAISILLLPVFLYSFHFPSSNLYILSIWSIHLVLDLPLGYFLSFLCASSPLSASSYIQTILICSSHTHFNNGLANYK